VLVGDDGRIKVTDFGIAHAGDPQMTEVGSIVGTAQYLSPEQARGRSVGPQTDIYSLGVVLYEMLTGRVPFEGDSSVAIAMQHVSDAPPPLRGLAPDVPESLALVVAHAMLKEPSQRYGSADEFSADLDRVRRGLVPVAATAVTSAIPREPTERVPAVEATRIAPRPEPTPLLSGDKLPPARATLRKRSRWPWLLVLLLLLAVGALAAFALGGIPGGENGSSTTTTATSTETTQPVAASHTLENLAGKSFMEASSAVQGYGLGIQPTRQRVRSSMPADVVVASEPEAGQVLHKGDSVLLKVSRGQKVIPNVVGSTQAEAQDQLGSDFKLTTKSEASDTIDKGSVIKTEPNVGTKIPVGSPVTVWISTGPASVQVPELKGKSEDEARQTLISAGLIAHEPPGIRCSDAVEPGQVAKQFPDVGKLVQKGSDVRFDLANSACTINVPSLRGRSVDEAQTTLSDLKIKSRVVSEPVSELSQDGQVLDQDIEGINTKPFTVTLTVGAFDETAATTTTP
jgi:beta-lactam-binding protein with PASTA domain